MDENGGKLLVIAENGLKWLKWLEIAGKGLKWLNWMDEERKTWKCLGISPKCLLPVRIIFFFFGFSIFIKLIFVLKLNRKLLCEVIQN